MMFIASKNETISVLNVQRDFSSIMTISVNKSMLDAEQTINRAYVQIAIKVLEFKEVIVLKLFKLLSKKFNFVNNSIHKPDNAQNVSTDII